LRGAGARLEAALREPLPDRWIGHHPGELRVELHHDGARRARRRDEALPGPGLEAGIARFAEGRQPGQRSDPLVARHGERAQLAASNLRQGRGDVRKHRRDAAADQIGHRVGAALVGNRRHDGAGAGAIFDHHLLPERLRHLREHRAREEVGRAARRVGHDQADRLRRISLRLRGRRRGDRRGGEREAAHQYGHGNLPTVKCGWILQCIRLNQATVTIRLLEGVFFLASLAQPEDSSRLQPYIHCDGFAGGVRGVTLDRRPPTAEPWREVSSGGRTWRVSVVEGYRVMYSYPRTYPFASLKAERSDLANYAADKQVVMRSLEELASADGNTELAGFSNQGFSGQTVTKKELAGSTIGITQIFSDRDLVI